MFEASSTGKNARAVYLGSALIEAPRAAAVYGLDCQSELFGDREPAVNLA